MSSYAGGEIELVGRIAERIQSRGLRKTILGPGDDAAVIPGTSGPTVVTVDTVTEGQDFRWTWPSGVSTSLYDVGWKLAAQNLSDINAMGGTPTYMVLSCTLDPHATTLDLTCLIDGILDACEKLGQGQVELIGGDTGKGREFSATLTVLGIIEPVGEEESVQPLLRSAAKPGDKVYVAGGLGRAAAGLAILESGRPELVEKYPDLIAAQLRPEPDLSSGLVARRAGVLCGMDISDGLVIDITRIATASNVRIEVDEKAMQPYMRSLASAADSSQADLASWVMTGGEDYSLLVAGAPSLPLPPNFICIGSVDKERSRQASRLTASETSFDSLFRGWDPFATTD